MDVFERTMDPTLIEPVRDDASNGELAAYGERTCNERFGARTTRRILVCGFVALLSVGAQPALGRSCDRVAAVPGATGYQARSNSNRCEGMYRTPVSGERLEFLSLVAGEIRYDLASDKALSVAVPDVRQLQAADVSVRATSLQRAVFYQMDAQVASAKSIEWPLDTVVAPERLQSNDIGVLGWINRGVEKIYVPVSVFRAAKSDAAPAATVAIFRSNVDIESVRWRLWAAPDRARTPLWHTLGGPIPAGEAFRLPVTRAGQVQRLEIAANAANSDDAVTELFRVFVP